MNKKVIEVNLFSIIYLYLFGLRTSILLFIGTPLVLRLLNDVPRCALNKYQIELSDRSDYYKFKSTKIYLFMENLGLSDLRQVLSCHYRVRSPAIWQIHSSQKGRTR